MAGDNATFVERIVIELDASSFRNVASEVERELSRIEDLASRGVRSQGQSKQLGQDIGAAREAARAIGDTDLERRANEVADSYRGMIEAAGKSARHLQEFDRGVERGARQVIEATNAVYIALQDEKKAIEKQIKAAEKVAADLVKSGASLADLEQAQRKVREAYEQLAAARSRESDQIEKNLKARGGPDAERDIARRRRRDEELLTRERSDLNFLQDKQRRNTPEGRAAAEADFQEKRSRSNANVPDEFRSLLHDLDYLGDIFQKTGEVNRRVLGAFEGGTRVPGSDVPDSLVRSQLGGFVDYDKKLSEEFRGYARRIREGSHSEELLDEARQAVLEEMEQLHAHMQAAVDHAAEYGVPLPSDYKGYLSVARANAGILPEGHAELIARAQRIADESNKNARLYKEAIRQYDEGVRDPDFRSLAGADERRQLELAEITARHNNARHFEQIVRQLQGGEEDPRIIRDLKETIETQEGNLELFRDRALRETRPYGVSLAGGGEVSARIVTAEEKAALEAERLAKAEEEAARAAEQQAQAVREAAAVEERAAARAAAAAAPPAAPPPTPPAPPGAAEPPDDDDARRREEEGRRRILAQRRADAEVQRAIRLQEQQDLETARPVREAEAARREGAAAASRKAAKAQEQADKAAKSQEAAAKKAADAAQKAAEAKAKADEKAAADAQKAADKAAADAEKARAAKEAADKKAADAATKAAEKQAEAARKAQERADREQAAAERKAAREKEAADRKAAAEAKKAQAEADAADPDKVADKRRRRLALEEQVDKRRTRTDPLEIPEFSAQQRSSVQQREILARQNAADRQEARAALIRQVLGDEEELAKLVQREVDAQEVAAHLQTQIDAELVNRRNALAGVPAEQRLARRAGESEEAYRARIDASRQVADARERAQRNALTRKAIEEEEARTGTRGTFFQRVQRYVSQREGGETRPIESYSTLGQALASGAITTARFAITGAVLYNGVQGIKALVTEAEKSELAFARLKAEFDALGDSQGFEKARQGVLSIARDTGISAAEIADLQLQLRGAYQGIDPQTGERRSADDANNAAIRDARTAAEVTVTTGLSLTETTDSLTSAALAYGATFEDIGNKAIGLQDRFGVLSKETIKFFGDLAPVAKQYGLTLNELGALEGVAQRSAGKSGAALAEGLGRVLPNLEANASSLLRLYSSVPALQGSKDNVTQDIIQGQYGKVFIQLLRDQDKLTEGQKKYIITLLGGSRQAQDIIPIFNNYRDVLAEIDGNINGQINDQGRLGQSYEEASKTVAQAFRSLSESFKQIGQEAFKAGLAQAFHDAATAGEALVKVLGGAATFMSGFNELTHGAAIRVIELVVALKAVSVLLSAIGSFQKAAAGAAALNVVAGATGGVTPGQAEGGLLARVGAALAPATLGARAGGTLGRFNAAARGEQIAASSASRLSTLGTELAPTVLLGRLTGGLARFGSTRLGFAGQAANGGGYALGLPGLGGALELSPLLFAAGAFAITVVGIAAVAHYYSENQKKLKKSADQVRQLAAKAPTDRLKATLRDLDQQKNSGSTVDKFVGFAARNLFDDADPAKILADELRSRNRIDLGGRLSALRNVLTPKPLPAGGTGPRLPGGIGLDAASTGDFNAMLKAAGFSDTEIKDINEGRGQYKTKTGFDSLRELQSKIAQGDLKAGELAQRLLDNYKLTPEQTKQYQAAVGGATAEQRAQLLATDADARSVYLYDLQTAFAAYQQGDPNVGYSSVIKLLDTTRSTLEAAYKKAIAQGASPEFIQKLLADLQQVSSQEDQVVQAAIQQTVQLATLSGAVTAEGPTNNAFGAAGSIVQAHASYLKGNLGKLTPDQRISETNSILQEIAQGRQARAQAALSAGAAFEEIIGAITPSPELQAVLDQYVKDQAQRGIDVSVDLKYLLRSGTPEQIRQGRQNLERDALAFAQAQNSRGVFNSSDPNAGAAAARDNARLALEQAQKDANRAAEQAQTLLPAAQAGYDKAVTDYAQAQADAAENIGGANTATVAGAKQRLDDAKAALDSLTATASGQSPALLQAQTAYISAQDQYVQSQISVTQSNFGVLQAQAGHNQRAVLGFQLQAARSQIAQASAIQDPALRQQTINQGRIAEAQANLALVDLAAQERLALLNIQKQKDSANRLKSAYDDIAIADEEARSAAKGDLLAQRKAQQDRIAAQQNLAQVLDDIANSRIDLSIAQSEAAGDVIGAAQKQVNKILQQIDQAKARGSGEDVLNGLYAQLAGAQANVTQTFISETERRIQTNLDLGRISRGQAIAQLQALRAQVASRQHTQQELDQIDLEIRQLQQSGGNGSQFNLPSSIELPTIYEARRLNQTAPGQPYGGVVDARYQQVILNINNGMDLQQAEQFLARSLGTTSAVFGAQSRRY